MTNYQFLKKYMDLQKGIMFDKIEDTEYARLAYCEGDKSSFWNCALVDKPVAERELLKIENWLTNLERKPAVYFEGREDLLPLVNFLTEKGYKKENEDSWMFYDGLEIDKSQFESVKTVKTEEDLEEYIAVLDACYENNDPQNPYGKLGEYLDVTRKSWEKFQGTNRLEYFTVYKNNVPVAVSTLTNFDGIGYLSNIGSKRLVRGEGFGKLATLFAVQRSYDNGNAETCLATEEGNYPNEFYKRIGFSTRFPAPLYVK